LLNPAGTEECTSRMVVEFQISVLLNPARTENGYILNF